MIASNCGCACSCSQLKLVASTDVLVGVSSQELTVAIALQNFGLLIELLGPCSKGSPLQLITKSKLETFQHVVIGSSRVSSFARNADDDGRPTCEPPQELNGRGAFPDRFVSADPFTVQTAIHSHLIVWRRWRHLFNRLITFRSRDVAEAFSVLPGVYVAFRLPAAVPRMTDLFAAYLSRVEGLTSSPAATAWTSMRRRLCSGSTWLD